MITNRPRVTRRAVSREYSAPAPFLGWNAKESLAEMDPRSAVFLDNWFPTPTDVRVRKGSANYSTGLSVPCETLMAYASGTTRQIFAAIGGDIFNVTAGGALPAAAVTGLASARWQHTQFENNAGNHFLVLVNGVDSPRNYNGSAWSVPAITGVPVLSSLRNVCMFKNRLFFVEDNSMNIWYLPIASIAGAAQKINVGAQASRGGNVRACFTIPSVAGESPDDYFGVITDQGELMMFAGNDPGNAAAWALVGTFQTGRPVGWRCWTRWGDDIALLTDLGLISIKSVINSSSSTTVAISDSIRNALAASVAAAENQFGWQVIAHTREKQLIVNLPSSSSEPGEQYVMNTDHGAWCRFRGWQAQCLEVFDEKLFYGAHTVIRQANIGQSDAGELIEADGATAYDYLGNRGRTKHFKMIKPTFVADGSVSASITMGADFGLAPIAASPPITVGGGFSWDVTDWDVGSWSEPPKPSRNWVGAGVYGDCVSTRVRVRTSAAEIKWMSLDVLYELGGVL
jgi:hypothetical protein